MQNVHVNVLKNEAKSSLFTKLIVFVLFLIGLHILFVYKFTIVVAGNHFLLIKFYALLTGLFLVSRFLILIFYEDRHEAAHSSEAYPSVSFVIAGKNEEDSIFKTIVTCMESAYPAPLECIAVDDGSTDKTRQEMLRAAEWYVNQDKRVRVIGFDKNRGKREAMAEGILAATGDIVVFVDSDSFLEKSAVKHIVEHFLNDPQVGAVAGNTGVENVDANALSKMQSARYGISFDIFKACESVFGVVTCCPGCFSAYRRDVLLSVLNEWRNQTFLNTRSTFGDDRSLTNSVLRKWKVEYCQAAYAVTIVPTQYKKFFKQQLRWKKSWVREGLVAASFIWKKNIIASLSFYTNLLLPIFSPLVVFYALIVQPFYNNEFSVVFLFGVIFLAGVYGLFYFWMSNNKYWWYIVPFTLMYTLLLVWQMPYAAIKLKDTTWGTR
jgi:hyaluronan synthase